MNFGNRKNVEPVQRNIATKNRDMLEQRNRDYQNEYNNIISNRVNLKPAYDTDGSLVLANRIRFKRVCYLSRLNKETAALIMYEQIRKVFLSLWSIKVSFFTYIHSDGNEISIYVGTDRDISMLQHIYEGAVTGVGFDERVYNFADVLDINSTYVGMFSGDPIVKSFHSNNSEFSVFDELMAGTHNISWNLLISAIPVEYEKTNQQFADWVARATESSEYISAGFTAETGEKENMSTTKKYIGSETYCKLAGDYCNVLKESLKYGQWKVTANCFNSNKDSLYLFGGMYSSLLLSGEEEIERPFPIRFYEVPYSISPLSSLIGNKGTYSLLSSNELASMCPFPVKDVFGLKVSDYSEFDVSVSQNQGFKIGNIISNSKETSIKYTIDINSLNRHGLVIGLTGGGKSNTVKSMLKTVSDFSVPFMVIEPAKKEYYEIYKMGLKNLQVYSVGSTGDNILKINPFECIKGTSIQQHIESVFAAFKASFIMYTPMPYYLEKAIYEIYTDRGWDIESNTNIYGRTDYPTLEDLYFKIEPIVRKDGFDSKMQKDLTGSLKARINSLRVGSKGRTLNVAKSFPIKHLLEGNTVIELDDVGDEDAKAFIISLILMQIQEFRKSEECNYQLELRHLLLIEEAHRLLKNVPSGTGENADPRGAAVEYFCNMLAELRSKGQGFLVIDQIPSKLAPDLIKNTNMKIIHRTVDLEDRELVGGAMHMDDRQKEYLACIGQGVAAVYSEGDNRPKLVKMPYAGDFEESVLKNWGREDIIRAALKNNYQSEDSFDYVDQKNINRMCSMCKQKDICLSKNKKYGLLENFLSNDDIGEIFNVFNTYANEKKNIKEFFSFINGNFMKRDKIISSGFPVNDIKNCIYALCVRYCCRDINDNLISSLYDFFRNDINK